ncbi:uncharacterized protein LOC119022121 isoform X4 [Acanthopagrus latus]|uniref:uncharacterized protein LOC119022121 isoform X4 n=1 Tax=Acanthopagrus latus TaxID=8177 RepID=UPI00187D0255|nr:uncharacterized protein LOC119022121 isoform X4 [Acanthopagrus latus]
MWLCDWLSGLTCGHVKMAATVLLLVLLLSGFGSGSGSGPDSERGRMELRRVQSLAAQPRYGECWARALEHLDTRCRDLTSESQSRIALGFTMCHLSSSGRDFPSCPEGSEVSRCTGAMDAIAFNAYTEFFTHTHSICHHLQSEAWQSQAEDTMYRLTESSAGVAEQLQSTRQMAAELIDAQSAALQAQQEILNNGEELRVTLRDSTQGLRAVFSELSSVSRAQQVALSELFNRVSFLQSFLLTEATCLSSICYNAAALCTSYLLTSTQRSSRARLGLLAQVCLNFYLERRICQFVLSSDHPDHKHAELISVYVSVLRRFMVCVGVCVLLCVCVRYRDPVQQNLEVLQQLRETQRGLQEALQHTERFRQQTENQLRVKRKSECRRRVETPRRRRERTREEQQQEAEESSPTDGSNLSHLSQIAQDLSDLSHAGWRSDSLLSSTVMSSSADITLRSGITHNASVQTTPGGRPRGSSPSPLVYSVLVEDKQPRYSLRSRRSETH